MLAKFESFLRQARFAVSTNQWLVRTLGLSVSDSRGNDESARGLLILQIDGLSRPQLEKALSNGSMPFLQRLISNEEYQLHSLYSGQPSSTPAVQGELFYGVKGCVPAFSFKQHEDNKTIIMVEPSAAARIEGKLEEQGGEPLLRGGSSYCNLFTGGAQETSFCASSAGWSNIMPTNSLIKMLVFALVKTPNIIRALILALTELGLAVVDLFRGVIAGRDFLQELKFVPMRIGASIIMRELVETGVNLDVTRGLPIVHANLIGYDEQAHRRGPSSKFAHWSLKGIDRAINRIWKTARRCPYRDYDIWVYSDHGQESVVPYIKQSGQTIQALLDSVFLQQIAKERVPHDVEVCRQTPAEAKSPRASWLGLPIFSYKAAALDLLSPSEPLPEVVAMGPIGLIYLPRATSDDKRKLMAKSLVADGNVPVVCALVNQGLENEKVLAWTKLGQFELPHDGRDVFGSAHPFYEDLLEDFVELVRHPDSGDLLISGWSDDSGHALSFRVENGSHAGPGVNETHAFALLPVDTRLPVTKKNYLRLLSLRAAALNLLGRGMFPESESENAPIERRRDFQNTVKGKAPEHRHCLRVMTYNIHSCIGMDGQVSAQRIARVIARYQPDVVCLQEVDVDRAKTNHIDQAALIANELGMDIRFHPVRHLQRGRFGNAILTDLPMRRIKAEALSVPRQTRVSRRPFNEVRGALWAEVTFNGKPVNILVTHLGLTPNERKHQVTALLGSDWLGRQNCLGPTVLCGDFNASTGQAAVERIATRLTNVQNQLYGGAKNKTFPSRFPSVCLDHVFIDDSSTARAVMVGNTSLAKLASDHLPLIADIEI